MEGEWVAGLIIEYCEFLFFFAPPPSLPPPSSLLLPLLLLFFLLRLLLIIILLISDEAVEVERQAQSIILTVEELVGESVQQYF